jgi:hypothetical protein
VLKLEVSVYVFLLDGLGENISAVVALLVTRSEIATGFGGVSLEGGRGTPTLTFRSRGFQGASEPWLRKASSGDISAFETAEKGRPGSRGGEVGEESSIERSFPHSSLGTYVGAAKVSAMYAFLSSS